MMLTIGGELGGGAGFHVQHSEVEAGVEVQIPPQGAVAALGDEEVVGHAHGVVDEIADHGALALGEMAW